MADKFSFAQSLAKQEKTTENEVAIAVAWFLNKASGVPPNLYDVCDFIEGESIRHNLNRHRLQGKLTKDVRVSAPKGKPIRVKAATTKDLEDQFGFAFGPKQPTVDYSLLSADQFERESAFLKELNRQLNASYEFENFDCAAVMMRRLMECLLIRAFNKSGGREEIVIEKNYLGLEKIISQAVKTEKFHLSRGSERVMNAVKKVGDKGAHSSNYNVQQSDLSSLATDYRALTADLLSV